MVVKRTHFLPIYFLDIMAKHISNKMITCDEKDAPWDTPAVKTAIRRKSRVYRVNG